MSAAERAGPPCTLVGRAGQSEKFCPDTPSLFGCFSFPIAHTHIHLPCGFGA